MGSMPVPVSDHESEEEDEDEDYSGCESEEYDDLDLCFVPSMPWPPQPYMFEPTVGQSNSNHANDEDSDEDESESEDDEDSDEGESLAGLGEGRSGASVLTDWCTCGECNARWLQRDSEHTCCHELPAEFADKHGLTSQGGEGTTISLSLIKD